jgi:hypothetical protein
LEEFERVLRDEVAALEALRAEDRARWLELLSYLAALVYHDRSRSEHYGLQETIEASVRTDAERREVHHMGQTMAEYLEEKGEKKGLQEALLLQLKQRFKQVPPEIEEAIKATTKVQQLKRWLRRVLSANSLEEMDIGPPS